jgi:CheY-like chemotaxis protein
LGASPFDDRYKHPAPNLLVLDLNLPRLNGLELLAWLRTQPDFEHVRIIVLTGSAQKDQVETAYRMGASSYLVKPTQSRNLQRMIDALYQYWIVHNHLPETMPEPAPKAKRSSLAHHKSRH